MATAFVQRAAGNWASGTTFTASITPTAGNLLIASVHLWGNNNSITISGVADGTNGAYTLTDKIEGSAFGVNVAVAIFYFKNTAAAALTVTATVDSSSVDKARLVVEEVSGADTAAPLGAHEGAVQAAPGTSPDGVSSFTSGTTAVAGDYVYAATVSYAATMSTGTGFTSGDTAVSGFRTEYWAAHAGGSQAGTFTASGDVPCRTAVAMFKVAAAGGGGPLVNGGSITHGSLIRGGRIAG